MKKPEHGLVIASAMMLAVVAGCSWFAARDHNAGPDVVEGGIRFRYYDPTAVKVQLAASWPENNWAKGDGSGGEYDVGLMTPDSDGMWEIVIALRPGRYKYLFWVNENTWRLDPGNPEEVAGGPVGVASQLVVFSHDGGMEIR